MGLSMSNGITAIVVILLFHAPTDALTVFRPIKVGVSGTMYSLCSMSQAASQTNANSVTACGINCLATSDCNGFNFFNDTGACSCYVGTPSSTNFTISTACQYFQKLPLNFAAVLTVGTKSIYFLVKSIATDSTEYHVFFQLQYKPIGRPIASSVVNFLDDCSISCQTNRACAGYVYESSSGLCSEYNERLPANYTTAQPGSVYNQKSPLSLAQNCLDHFNNGRRTNGIYSVFVNGDPGLMVNIYCLNMTTVPYVARDCSEIQSSGLNVSGIYYLNASSNFFQAYCNMTIAGGGWTVVQRRIDGSETFKRNWNEYAYGFGSFTGEFWLGNDKLVALTYFTGRSMKLRFDMVDKNGLVAFAEYFNFVVQPSSSKYKVHVDSFLGGNAGDSFSFNNNQYFTTYDEDNDNWPAQCSVRFGGSGWWYSYCHECNPNGMYGNEKFGEGINWNAWHGRDYSLPYIEMKIKPM